jgi:hypothetical protein
MFHRILISGILALLIPAVWAVQVEDFEFATDNATAAAGVTVTPDAGVTLSVLAGSGADANEGTHSLGIDFASDGTTAFQGGFILRTLATPITLSRTYTEGGAPGSNLTDLRFTLDIKGAAGLTNTNIWLFIHNGEGDRFRYINFSDAALSNTGYTDDRQIGLGQIDRDAGSTGSGNLSQITAFEIYIQNPDMAAKSGTLFVDDLQVNENPSQWGPGIEIDGSFDDWDGQVPLVFNDPSGDATTGRDLIALYAANDAENLYVRLQYAGADVYDGNNLIGIDGDASNFTGYNLAGTNIGSDTLIAGASAYGETTSTFNAGAASPDAVLWGPFTSDVNIEFAVPLNMTVPGDITQSFPGGLGSLIRLAYTDTPPPSYLPDDIAGPGGYVLASAPSFIPLSTVIDAMSLYDTDPHALLRTHDISNPGSTAVAANRPGGGPGGAGDTALQVTHTNPSGTAFVRSLIEHRIAFPVNIAGNDDVTIDVFGDPALTAQNFVVGLRDADGDSFAIGTGAPVSAEWTTISLGPTSGWFDQNPGTGDDVLDTGHIVGWYAGTEEQTTSGSTATLGYDNLQIVITTTGVDRQTWTLYR